MQPVPPVMICEVTARAPSMPSLPPVFRRVLLVARQFTMLIQVAGPDDAPGSVPPPVPPPVPPDPDPDPAPVPFETVTGSGADVETLPALSRASAVSVCAPSVAVVVSQLVK